MMDTTTESVDASRAVIPQDDRRKGDRRKRKFPGPAGNLPPLKPTEMEHSEELRRNYISPNLDNLFFNGSMTEESFAVPQVLQLNQSQESSFEEPTWTRLLSSLGFHPNDRDPECLLAQVNTNWVAKRAFNYRLPASARIPFLLVMIQETSNFYSQAGFARMGGPKVTLVDPTGTIEAAVDGKLVEAYGKALTAGTALALRNVDFLQCRRQATLIITQANIITISSKSVDQSCVNVMDSQKSFVTDDQVLVRHFCEFDREQIVKDLLAFDSSNVSSEFLHAIEDQKILPFLKPSATSLPDVSVDIDDAEEDDLFLSQILEKADNNNVDPEFDEDDGDFLLSQIVDVADDNPKKEESHGDDESFPDEEDEFFNFLEGVRNA